MPERIGHCWPYMNERPYCTYAGWLTSSECKPSSPSRRSWVCQPLLFNHYTDGMRVNKEFQSTADYCGLARWWPPDRPFHNYRDRRILCISKCILKLLSCEMVGRAGCTAHLFSPTRWQAGRRAGWQPFPVLSKKNVFVHFGKMKKKERKA